MTERLEGRAALVTGAGQGIGLAIARALVHAGAAVMVNDAHAERVREAVAELQRELRSAGARPDRVAGFAADVRDSASVREMVAQAVAAFGGLDVAVCNAGIYPETPFVDLSEDEWDAVLDINLKGTFLVAQAAARRMIQQGRGGHIVTIASGSWQIARRGCAHYCASKAGQAMLTRVMAMELAEHRIQVNSVAPGLIENPYSSPEYVEGFRRQIPWGRVGTPEDIAKAVLMVVGCSSEYMTGQIIGVDGGASLGRYGLPIGNPGATT